MLLYSFSFAAALELHEGDSLLTYEAILCLHTHCCLECRQRGKERPSLVIKFYVFWFFLMLRRSQSPFFAFFLSNRHGRGNYRSEGSHFERLIYLGKCCASFTMIRKSDCLPRASCMQPHPLVILGRHAYISHYSQKSILRPRWPLRLWCFHISHRGERVNLKASKFQFRLWYNFRVALANSSPDSTPDPTSPFLTPWIIPYLCQNCFHCVYLIRVRSY